MVVDGSYPNDIRVRKEAEALANVGKNIVVVCPLTLGFKKEDVINGVHVHRIGNNYTHFKKGIFDIIESVFNVNPFFYFHLKKVFKRYQINFLHVHDLPLAGTCYLFKDKVKGNLILDLHENFPEALKTWFLWKKNPIIRLKNKIFMNPFQWSKKEEKYCNKYDKIICVVEEMKEKLISKFNIDTNKMLVVSNQEKKSFIANFNENIMQDVINKDTFSITYVGGFGPHRGLDTAIKGMSKIINTIPNAKLFLIGKGSSDVENKLLEIATTNHVEDHVNFVGYRPFKEVSAIMSASSINIIPHNADEHTNNTIPHKLFQIMLSNSMLLVSSCKPLKRIVEKYDAGLVFEAGNAKDFSDKVIDVFTNFEKFSYKKENAFNAVMEKGENWDAESLKLIALYDKLEN